MLRNFQDTNHKTPVQYPTIQARAAKHTARSDSRPTLPHTQSALVDPHPPIRSPERPRPSRRADTTFSNDITIESSLSAYKASKEELRLVTPQLARDLSVLKVDTQPLGSSSWDSLHALDQHRIAACLDEQIGNAVNHLFSLQVRIEDTSSKVLVTGDLNAGKSTFCNALLRRKVLPEDQLPCTSIFCEVLDFRENGGVEEVHAIPIGASYNRNDESTYTVFSLEDLEKIVVDNEHFSQCKIYIKDSRDNDESILHNGVVDIVLIDAPGLNADSLQTTAVFARQEEIDVVVFVVSATDHFTESASNFISNAAQEKSYIFMVVNRFDVIRDQQRCQERILKQVYSLSPATFKESRELVHFVSSDAVPVQGFGGSPPDDDDDEPTDKGKGKELEKRRDFATLEASLRRFVLEKRSRSKLAPAKTYLLNVLGDLHGLATYNRDIFDAELDRAKKEIAVLEPELDDLKKSRSEVGKVMNQDIENCALANTNYTQEMLKDALTKIGEPNLGIRYPGFFSAYQFAEDIRDSMLCRITESVRLCEEHARGETVRGYNGIKNLGMLHLGNNLWADVTFRPERMFRKSAHAHVRDIDIDIALWDFFDVSGVWQRQEKIAGTSMALTVGTVVGGRLAAGTVWHYGAFNAVKIMGLKNVATMLTLGLLGGVAVGGYLVLASIPKSLPHRLSTKLAQQLAATHYIDQNALRIGNEIRRALKGAADSVRIGFQRNIEKVQVKRAETSKLRMGAEVASKYFGNLVRSSDDLRQMVQQVDLDAAPPAAFASEDV